MLKALLILSIIFLFCFFVYIPNCVPCDQHVGCSQLPSISLFILQKISEKKASLVFWKLLKLPSFPVHSPFNARLLVVPWPPDQIKVNFPGDSSDFVADALLNSVFLQKLCTWVGDALLFYVALQNSASRGNCLISKDNSS